MLYSDVNSTAFSVQSLAIPNYTTETISFYYIFEFGFLD